MATHTDPVCGMKVDEESAAGQSTYRENTYYSAARTAKRSLIKIRSYTRVKKQEVESRRASLLRIMRRVNHQSTACAQSEG
jgi:YHS domain-containing protein